MSPNPTFSSSSFATSDTTRAHIQVTFTSAYSSLVPLKFWLHVLWYCPLALEHDVLDNEKCGGDGGGQEKQQPASGDRPCHTLLQHSVYSVFVGASDVVSLKDLCVRIGFFLLILYVIRNGTATARRASSFSGSRDTWESSSGKCVKVPDWQGTFVYSEEPEPRPVITEDKHIDSEHAIMLYEGEMTVSYGTGTDMSHRMNHKLTVTERIVLLLRFRGSGNFSILEFSFQIITRATPRRVCAISKFMEHEVKIAHCFLLLIFYVLDPILHLIDTTGVNTVLYVLILFSRCTAL